MECKKHKQANRADSGKQENWKLFLKQTREILWGSVKMQSSKGGGTFSLCISAPSQMCQSGNFELKAFWQKLSVCIAPGALFSLHGHSIDHSQFLSNNLSNLHPAPHWLQNRGPGIKSSNSSISHIPNIWGAGVSTLLRQCVTSWYFANPGEKKPSSSNK